MHLPSAANSSVIILFLILFTITYPNTPPNQKYHVFIQTKQGIILSCTLPVNRLSFSALDRFIYRDQESLFCPYPSSVLDLKFHITLSGTMLSHMGWMNMPYTKLETSIPLFCAWVAYGIWYYPFEHHVITLGLNEYEAYQAWDFHTPFGPPSAYLIFIHPSCDSNV